MLLGLTVFSERKKPNEADSILEFEKLKAQVLKLSLSTLATRKLEPLLCVSLLGVCKCVSNSTQVLRIMVMTHVKNISGAFLCQMEDLFRNVNTKVKVHLC